MNQRGATHCLCSDITKRVFDIVVSGAGLCILLPLLSLIAVLIRVDSSGPVVFRQTRVGRHGVPFCIHKFRTMHVGAESEGALTVGDDNRVTKVGRWLRYYKLDELLQLMDVFRGKMSLVGPRPEVPRYVTHYPAAIREKVLSVRPGITDWASIYMIAENEILACAPDPERAYLEQILPKKLEYYVQYVDTYSLWQDIKIVMVTLARIVAR